jgi:ribose 1,5-bisphosphokinase
MAENELASPDAADLAEGSVARPVAATGEGVLVAVVGPSGAGKDSLISAARRANRGDTRVVFARRIVTRAPDGHEIHDSVDVATFREMERDGAFLMTWQANGLCYGLPAALGDALASGRAVVANVSRSVVPDLRQRFARTLIVQITAPPHVIARRLSARGRETPAEQGRRLARASAAAKGLAADITIDNGGALEEAAARFNAVIAALLRGRTE